MPMGNQSALRFFLPLLQQTLAYAAVEQELRPGTPLTRLLNLAEVSSTASKTLGGIEAVGIEVEVQTRQGERIRPSRRPKGSIDMFPVIGEVEAGVQSEDGEQGRQ